MFIGHYALGFGAKAAAPRVSLGTLFLACQFADLVWPILVLAGIERVAIDRGATAFTPLDFASYPYSHSLAALALWAAVVAGVYSLARGARTADAARGALTLAALVLSHWVLDVLTHRPDMPLTMGGASRIGLGLWHSVPGTLAVEGMLLAVGIWLYTRRTRPIDRTGHWAFWTLVAFLVTVEVANLLGPPPPSPTAVAWAAQSMWLLVAWGYWIDRHRAPAASARTATA